MATWDWPSWGTLGHDVVQQVVALTLALSIGWERERDARSAGVRTFPLVAMACCGYLQITLEAIGHDEQSLARVMFGLMTGIGFIGGGAIVKGSSTVHGTATAASIWTTGAIGAACAFDRYHVALLLTALNFLVLRGSEPLKQRIRRARGEPPHGDDRERQDDVP